jgi:D-beta-D-heptose 7-phosphate kinase/D-beta-D-heptose 1-phosphate adenosyltransferase
MTSPTINRKRAKQILDGARERRVVVLGDVMLDEFIWGDVSRISPEAPVPVVDVKRESTHLGGAANVLANLLSLGADGGVVGIIGNDYAADRIRLSLKEKSTGQRDQFLIAADGRPTTIKTRIIAQHQMVVRADRENRTPVNGEIEQRIISVALDALANAHALVISDYDKGVITRRVLESVLPEAYQRMPVLIDPKLRNFDWYRPATLVTPNHHEAFRLTGVDDSSESPLQTAAARIREILSCDAVLITRGDRGMVLFEKDNPPVKVKTAAREVFDVTGAGDTVIATLALALAAGASMTEAALLANYAAGIVVGKLGTATATRDEVLDSIE